MGEIISGHTVKHLVSTAASYWIIRMFHLRQPVDAPPASE